MVLMVTGRGEKMFDDFPVRLDLRLLVGKEFVHKEKLGAEKTDSFGRRVQRLSALPREVRYCR